MRPRHDNPGAIPLVRMHSPSTNASDHMRSRSLDSETSAILSYALGKEVAEDAEENDTLSPRSSSALEDAEAAAFFKENDPLDLEYDYPQRKVPSLTITRLIRNHDSFGCGYLLL